MSACICDDSHVCQHCREHCHLCGNERELTEDMGLCLHCERTARNSGGPYDRQRHIEAWRFKRHGMEG